MAEIKQLADTTLQKLDPNATLADGVRKGWDYDNSTELDLECSLYLSVLYTTTAPAEGARVAEVWNLPGDGESTENFPEGGDGTVGSNKDPQSTYYVGTLTAVDPSTTGGAEEIIGIPTVKLYPDTNRFVIKNICGYTWVNTWELRIKPRKLQTG